MRRLLIILAASILSCTCVPAAQACFWDSDTVRTEREFQQNYEFKSGDEQPQRGGSWSEYGLSWSGIVVACAGVGLMAASAGLVIYNQRKIGRV